MPPDRTIVDSEDEEQDSQFSPLGSPPAAQAHIIDPSNSSPDAPPAPDPSAITSTGSTAFSKEALNYSIHNAHFALMEPTPDAKTISTVIHPDLQPDMSSPLLPRTKRRNTSPKPDPPIHDEYTFVVSSASEPSPPPAKRARGKTMGPTIKAKDRKPQRSKSMGRPPDPTVEEEESDTWEPPNASRLMDEPIGLRRTRRMGDDGVVEGLPKPKRPKKNGTVKESVSCEIKIDLTNSEIALSATQKQEYERISVPPSSLTIDPPAVPTVGASITNFERETDQSSTIPFSSSPPIRDRFPERFKESQAAKLSLPTASISISSAPKTYSKIRRARTVMGTGNEHLDRSVSGDELSLGLERKKTNRSQTSKSREESTSKSGTGEGRSISKVPSRDDMSDEDELGLEGIGIVKERYKPRPSRSRRGHVTSEGEDRVVVKEMSTEVEASKTPLENERIDTELHVRAIPSKLEPKSHSAINEEVDLNPKPLAKAKRKKSTIIQDDDSNFQQEPKPMTNPKRKKGTLVQHTNHDSQPPLASLAQDPKPAPKKIPKQDTSTTEPNAPLSPLPHTNAAFAPQRQFPDPTPTTADPPAAQPPQSTPPPPQPTPDPKRKRPGQHSPLNSGKVPYRVGLSRRVRIEPLLRCVRK